MTKKTRRNHGPAHKAKIALAAVKGDKTLAELGHQYEVHTRQIVTWKKTLIDGAARLFEAGASGKGTGPEIDVKSLHAKIGELTLENDFLSGALDKAGLPSAKR